MSNVGDCIRSHHKAILSTVLERVETIVGDLPGADPRELSNILRGELLPHAVGEERYLYPALESVIHEHGAATATMTIDHEFIEGYIDWIEETVEELETADPEERPLLQALLRQLCLKFEAVLQMHVEKEERIYLHLLKRFLPEEEQARILENMDKAFCESFSHEEHEPMYAHKVAAPA